MKFLKNKNAQDGIVVFLLGTALGVYSVYSFTHARVKYEWKMSPYLFPLIVAIFAVLMAISLFADARREMKESENAPAAEKKPIAWKQLLNAAVVVICAVVYYILLPKIHFIAATILFLVALFIYFGERKWWLIAITSAATSGVIYVLFGILLNVRLP